MADQRIVTLYPGDATPKDVVLRDLPVAGVVTTPIYLRAGDATAKDIVLRDPTAFTAAGGVNVTPDVGVAVFAGLEPTVQTPRNVTAGLGELVFAGFSPTVTIAVNVLAGVGELEWVGYEPAVVGGTRQLGGAANPRRAKKKRDDTDVNTNHDALWAAASELNPILLPPDPRLVYGGTFDPSMAQIAPFQPAALPDTAQRLSPQLAALFALALDEMDE
jgi:hypothetical protein